MTDTLEWKCPVHGYGPAVTMGDGAYCTREDPERPHMVCGRKCSEPRWESSGKPLFDPDHGQKKSITIHRRMSKEKEGSMATYNVRGPGTATCTSCGKDMAGEHNRAKRCSECRERKKPPKAPPARPEPEATETPSPTTKPKHSEGETPSIASTPVARVASVTVNGRGICPQPDEVFTYPDREEAVTDGDPAGNGKPRSVLDRLADVERLLDGHDVAADLVRRIAVLERELAELREIVVGPRA